MSTSIATTSYEPFTEETAIAYIEKLNQKLGLFPAPSLLICKEIGDGNLNYVFHLSDSLSGQSLIIKQALPYAKVVGESWPLTLRRAKIEAEALQKAAETVPSLVPNVIHTDDDLAITVMEDLSDYTILRKGLIDGETYPNLGRHIGTYLAKTIFHSSPFGENQQEIKEISVRFTNPELCKITEDLVFTDPFFDHDTNDFEDHLKDTVNELWKNEELKLEAAKLKYIFLTKSEALIHGDLHTGSVFVTAEETKVIDPEFAFYGPAGFDLGLFIANILLNTISKTAIDEQQHSDLYQTIIETVEVFKEEYKKLWQNHHVEAFIQTEGYVDYMLGTIFEDAVGFAGCELIRRIIGLAHVADIDNISDCQKRLYAQQNALQLGSTFIIKRRNIRTIDQLIQETKDVLK
ncbi:S-methyl-5-thioribose kinase [Alkalihalophilus marmarensis]|uniref:Methylthioribose kinase n=1 Tax=Alkalihalophilus marmarensis DSM 21297 TaxID=1188261 RepID=U6ST14_9BACI|nr:S-methyl-5-thioribose kinase [Alkalihalophilus marmarensis]ERN54502.1 methylthioribose kinase [Alkalihalophilus marmarensis DSM 21297]